MKHHPAAALFPMMSERKLRALADDIKAQGLREPVLTYKGAVLDGRNRLLACRLAGVAPRFREYRGTNPLRYVMSANLARRHLSSSQLAMLGADLLPFLEEEAKARKGKRTDLGIKLDRGGRSREHAGRLTDCSPAYIAAAKAIVKDAPDVADHVRSGAISLDEGRMLSKVDRVTRRKIIAKKTTAARCNIRVECQRANRKTKLKDAATLAALNGKYQVWLIDPAWPCSDQTSTRSPENHYPSMTLSEIAALGKDIQKHCADSAVVFLWVTTPMLPHAFEVLKKWGVTYRSLYVWDKVLNEAGLGQWARNSHEALLVATKGNFAPPIAVPPSIYREARTHVHSQKPSGIHAFIEAMWPGVKLRAVELYARREPVNTKWKWTLWGAEAPTEAPKVTGIKTPRRRPRAQVVAQAGDVAA